MFHNKKAGWILGCLWIVGGLAQAGDIDLMNQFTFYGDNTEFFEPFRVRETILGQQFKSYLDGAVGDHTFLWGGIFADHRSAQDTATEVQPILSFIYRTDESEGVLGTIQPVARHGLIEPMEVTTLELTRPIEYGLQWIQKDSFLHMDAFLDWQQLLSPADREVFDYGGSAILPLDDLFAFEAQIHGYHIGGAMYGGLVRNNLAGGIGLKIQIHPRELGKTYLEVYALGSKDTNRPLYPGPTLGSGLYTKLSFSPDNAWEFFGLSWFGQDYMSEEGDSNYNSLGADGVYYKSSRTYEELGIRRFVQIESGVTFDFELRSHWIEDAWANSFRIVAQVPFDLGVMTVPFKKTE